MDFGNRSSNPRPGAEVLLRDLVFEKTGLVFEDSKLDLFMTKVAPLLNERGFGSYLDYYYLLKYDPASDEAWDALIDALTVQETYFWREMDQLHSLAEKVIPELLASRPGERIRIWCAACASGEEPLSIAMRLNEEGWFERADIQIIATDASPAALRKARSGLYSGRSFRSLPDAMREKYFTEEGKEWRISPAISRRITWGRVNLLDERAVSDCATASVIFCRNVFIYFAPETIRRVVESFARHIGVPGYLFVGASESLLKATDEFELEEIGNAFVYTKRN
jgi:chemotaxis protein methyltransferase CheR